MSKLVLLSSEYTKLGTGYGNCFKNLAYQLLKHGYNVVEYAAYCFKDDKTRFSSDWEIIPAAPDRNDKQAMEEYKKHPSNQFGGMYFDEVIAKVKPDVVIDWRDPWMMEHIVYTPAKKFYNTIMIPTLDSRPQMPHWLHCFSMSDILCTMSYFGKHTVEEEGDLKVRDVIPIGVDESFRQMYEKFKGENKSTFRRKYGIPTNGKLFTFVSRNQRRKLFPDVIYCMDKLIDEGLDIYVHFHTSYPDNIGGSWEFPLYLSRINNPNRFLFTYLCQRCKHVMVRTFADSITECPKCHGPMFMPSPQYGYVEREIQKEIMYAADFGINPAIGGGYEMNISEFKALGIPTISTSWAAMDEQGLRADGSIPPYNYIERNGIKDKPYKGGRNCDVYLWIEPESGQFRAYMNRNSFMDIVRKYYNLNKDELRSLQKEAYEFAKEYGNWDIVGDRFAAIIDTLPSTQHLYKYTPIYNIDENKLLGHIKQLPPELKVPTWNTTMNEYMTIQPHLINKAHADLMNIIKFGVTTPAKNVPTFNNMQTVEAFMKHYINKVNIFNQMRQRYK